jgi:hypothetical protein
MTRYRLGALAVFAGAAIAIAHAVRAEEPLPTETLFYSGMLEDNSELPTDSYDITLRLFDAPSGGTELCSQTAADTPVESGRFRIDASGCAAALRASPDTWSEVEFVDPDGNPHKITERAKVGSVPYALAAQHAVEASNAAGPLLEAIDDLRARVQALEEASPKVSAFSASLYGGATQKVPSGEWAWFAYNHESFDHSDEFNTSNGEFRTKSGGYYLFSCQVSWNVPTPTGTAKPFEVQIRINDVTVAYDYQVLDPLWRHLEVSATLKLEPNDRAFCRIYQETGGELALNGNGASYSSFSGVRIGP